MHVFHVTQLEKFLLFDEHQLYEVFVKHLCRWNVKLQLLLEVLDEVFFGAEAREQLLSQVLAFLVCHQLLVLLLLALHTI